MKTGTTLVEVLTQVKDQAHAARDLVVDTRALRMDAGDLLVEEAEQSPGGGVYHVRDIAHNQIATRLGIPAQYYQRLRTEQPDMLDYNVSELFRRKPERRMLRTLTEVSGKQARAFLSDRYRRFDNFQLAEAVLPVLGDQPELRFESCQLTERRMYLKAVFPRLQAEVKVGDVVQSGIVISNSEVGSGATEIAMLLYRLSCSNGAIVQDARSRRHHVGKHVDGNGEDVSEIYSDETLRADDQAFTLKLRDTVRAAINEKSFLQVVERAREAAGEQTKKKPTELVEVLANRASLSKSEGESLLEHLCAGGDFSRWGIANAITRTSQDVESYDRATELERVGGSLLSPNNAIWTAIRN